MRPNFLSLIAFSLISASVLAAPAGIARSSEPIQIVLASGQSQELNKAVLNAGDSISAQNSPVRFHGIDGTDVLLSQESSASIGAENQIQLDTGAAMISGKALNVSLAPDLLLGSTDQAIVAVSKLSENEILIQPNQGSIMLTDSEGQLIATVDTTQSVTFLRAEDGTWASELTTTGAPGIERFFAQVGTGTDTDSAIEEDEDDNRRALLLLIPAGAVGAAAVGYGGYSVYENNNDDDDDDDNERTRRMRSPINEGPNSFTAE